MNVLKAVLMTPLSKAIPVNKFGFAMTIGVDPALDDVFVINEVQVAKLFDTVTSTVMHLQQCGQSEKSWIATLDNLIMTMLNILAKKGNFDLNMDRNSTDRSGTTVFRKRPDFMCWLPSKWLALKGEEKADYADFETAKMELVEQMAGWSPVLFGALPFQLCYAFAGGHIQFFALKMEANKTLVPISDSIDLRNSPRSRSLCVRIVVNCYRVLRTLENYMLTSSQGVAPLFLNATIKKEGSSEVVIYTEYVRKIAYKHSGAILLQLYELLKEREIPYLARPVGTAKLNTKTNVFSVTIAPLGFFRPPHGMDEIKCAIRCVLSALKSLHSLGWVHCDIRIENIMCKPPNMEWYLMDLEYARFDGDECPPICSHFRPPELRSNGGKWTTSCDMWQVGRFMELLENNPYRELMETLLNCDAAKRPTACEALEKV